MLIGNARGRAGAPEEPLASLDGLLNSTFARPSSSLAGTERPAPALDQAVREGKLKPGDLIAISGFGAGLSWGATVVRWG